MGVYIKGMEMPVDCRDCRLMDFDTNSGKTWCSPADAILAEDWNPIPFDGRPDSCPLVEVEEPHGDLADVSEVKKCLHDLPDSEDKWGAIALLEWAMEKRTVIEGEEVEQ